MQQIPITDFTAGELSQKFLGRFDLQIYQKGAQEVTNWVPFSQGGITYLPGTEFLGYSRSSGSMKARYHTFVITESLKYELEFTANTIRVWKDDELVEDGGSPISFDTTYTIDEIFKLQFQQAYDKLYIVHRDHPPKVLTWVSGDTFTFANVTFEGHTEDLEGNVVEIPMTSTNNYPGCIGSWRGRMVYGSSYNQPHAFWVTKPFKHYSMHYYDEISYTTDQLTEPDTWDDPTVPEYEEVTTTKKVIGEGHAFTAELNAQFNDKIMWIEGKGDCLIGTASSEWILSRESTALNPYAEIVSRNGSAPHQALLASDVLMYVQGSNARIREFRYSGEAGYDSPDLLFAADHMLTEGVVEYAYMNEPEPSIWFVLADGTIAVMLYNKPHGVLGWFRIEYPNAEVESITISPGTGADTVYLSVNRSGTRTFEKMKQLFSGVHVDCGVQVTKSSDTVTGLDHLEGKEVAVQYGGNVCTATVSSGEIDLSGEGISNGTTLNIGLTHTATLKTMPLTTRSRYGIGQMYLKRIGNVRARVIDSYAFKAGYELDGTQYLEQAAVSDQTSDDIEIPVPADWTTEGGVVLVQDQPLAATVVALIAEVES